MPLATLPLLGYTVSVPSSDDNIEKNYVFKLRLKTHVYFFRTENDHSLMRWMETIRISASQHAREEHNQLISSINTQTNNQTKDDNEQQQPNNHLSLQRQAAEDNLGEPEDPITDLANYNTVHTEPYLTTTHIDHQQSNHYVPGTTEVYS